jgi:putative adhesin
MSEVQGRPAGTMSTERRYGIAISVALILGGVYWALTGLTEDSRTSNGSYQVENSAITIEAVSADVELRTGDVSEMTVSRKYNRNLFGSDPKEEYSDGKLQLKDTGCGFLSFGCNTHYEITVPKDLKVTIESSSGDLKVSELSGGATVRSSSGNIDVDHIGGQVTLKSSSGSIKAENLSASAVTGQSSSGDVELTFDLAPQQVEAQTSSGDVEIHLPNGSETYKVDAKTSSGDEQTTVKTDPASAREIKAKSSSGDTTIDYDN